MNHGTPGLPSRARKGTAIRISAGWCLVICCVALAACTASGPQGPAATVTTPAVGRPPAPASAAAALASEAFTPYAALGAAVNDGLAPGDTYDALHTACMQDAGYGQYASETAYPVRANRGLGFPQAWGPWGYVGTALAAEEGFLAPEGGPGQGGGGQGPGPGGNLPAAAQVAAGKCFNILENFNNATLAHYLSIVETLNNYIGSDVINDGEFRAAMRRWSACMAKQGFHSPDANSFAQQAQITLGQRPAPGQNLTGPPGQPTAAQNQAQIAEAVADANCTLSSDLSGVYFAVQASYEKQFVSANQQALDAGVRKYKAAFAHELKTMPILLQTTSATPNLPGPTRPGHHGRHGGTAKPSPNSPAGG
jgi:hypothetical protein